MRYSQKYRPQGPTPQTQPIPGREAEMVKNDAGGYGFTLADDRQMLRFLILGALGGTYYVKQDALLDRNKAAVERLIQANPMRAIDLIVAVTAGDRAPSKDPAIFALALALCSKDEFTRRYASDAAGKVCRIPTDWFQLAGSIDDLGGWGPAKRRAFRSFYENPDLKALAFHMLKYQQRNGWSHRDLLRLVHPKADTQERDLLFRWACYGMNGKPKNAEYTTEQYASYIFGDEAPPYWWRQIMGVHNLHQIHEHGKLTNVIMDDMIERHRLSMEMCPSELFKRPEFWASMLGNLGYTALLRNLGNMGKAGFLKQGQVPAIRAVVEHLQDPEVVSKSHVHPIAILKALFTYQLGHPIPRPGRTIKDTDRWPIVADVIPALESAMYAAFGNVRPTGKSLLLALDHSGSMNHGEVAGVPGFSPRDASAVMAMTVVKSEFGVVSLGFGERLRPLSLHKGMSLAEAVREIAGPPEGTDCALPVQYAEQENIVVDAFILYTDSQTWAGSEHVVQALARYRRRLNPEARFVVVQMTGDTASLIDPKDPLSLEVVGFDTATPSVIAGFIKGEF